MQIAIGFSQKIIRIAKKLSRFAAILCGISEIPSEFSRYPNDIAESSDRISSIPEAVYEKPIGTAQIPERIWRILKAIAGILEAISEIPQGFCQPTRFASKVAHLILTGLQPGEKVGNDLRTVLTVIIYLTDQDGSCISQHGNAKDLTASNRTFSLRTAMRS